VSDRLGDDVARVGDALFALANKTGAELAITLARLLTVVAEEAARSPRFATALSTALAGAPPAESAPARRGGRRAPGVLDPYEVYGSTGEAGLRTALAGLQLEELRDIVAQHGMDNDKLAMKWKNPSRVIGRIVERVVARVAKGSAFRGPVDTAGN